MALSPAPTGPSRFHINVVFESLINILVGMEMRIYFEQMCVNDFLKKGNTHAITKAIFLKDYMVAYTLITFW